MITTNLKSKSKAAYEHGRMDFWAGAACNPKIPPNFCVGLSDEDKKLISESWIDGWYNERLLQSLPDGSPA